MEESRRARGESDACLRFVVFISWSTSNWPLLRPTHNKFSLSEKQLPLPQPPSPYIKLLFLHRSRIYYCHLAVISYVTITGERLHCIGSYYCVKAKSCVLLECYCNTDSASGYIVLNVCSSFFLMCFHLHPLPHTHTQTKQCVCVYSAFCL